MISQFGNTLRNEFRTALTPGPRMADGIACIGSVLLAILLAHLIGGKMVAWAAFSAFVLMKGDPGETILRGVLRLVGTALGAVLAVTLVPLAMHSVAAASVMAGLIGAMGLYGMLTARRAYAWLLFGLTFEMILLDKLEKPGVNVVELAQTRMLEVVAGTVACVIVSVSAAFVTGRQWKASGAASPSLGWHPNAARHAIQAGVAVALLPLLHSAFGMAELAQASVTILAVMIVPVAGIGASGLVPVSRRLLHRAIGCIAGAALAFLVLILAHGEPAILIAGTCLGIFIGRHIETMGAKANYVGLQFTLAVLVVLVPDSYAQADIKPGLLRLLSIFIGMGLLEPVLLAWHLIAPRFETDAPATGSESE